MTAAFEFAREPHINDVQRQAFTDDTLAHGEDVGVVVIAAGTGRKGVVAERGTDAWHLVGGNADADASAADEDAAVTFTADNSAGGWLCDQRIVTVFVAVRDKINDGVAEGLEVFFDGTFEVIATMVGT